jgi:ceramide glucosyltransferase
VRKFTVFLATLVEPGTESLLCSLYLAFGVTTYPYFQERWYIPPTWSTFILVWLASVLSWMVVDYLVWTRLQAGQTIEGEGPEFLKTRRKRRFGEWVLGWAGREGLALGIWVWAVLGGVTVVWRGRRFWVGLDMRVHEIEDINMRSGAGKEKKG